MIAAIEKSRTAGIQPRAKVVLKVTKAFSKRLNPFLLSKSYLTNDWAWYRINTGKKQHFQHGTKKPQLKRERKEQKSKCTWVYTSERQKEKERNNQKRKQGNKAESKTKQKYPEEIKLFNSAGSRRLNERIKNSERLIHSCDWFEQMRREERGERDADCYVWF